MERDQAQITADSLKPKSRPLLQKSQAKNSLKTLIQKGQDFYPNVTMFKKPKKQKKWHKIQRFYRGRFSNCSQVKNLKKDLHLTFFVQFDTYES